MFFAIPDLKWLLRLEPYKWIVNPNPLLPKRPDIKINPGERAPAADGIGAIEEHTRDVARPVIRSLHPVEQAGTLKNVCIGFRHLVRFPTLIEKAISFLAPDHGVGPFRKDFSGLAPKSGL